jgi:hypothetical protein
VKKIAFEIRIQNMLKPKALLALKKNQVYALVGGFFALVLFIHVAFSRRGSKHPIEAASSSASGSEAKQQAPKEYPIHVHLTEQFVPATAYSGPLKKPLEVVGGTVSCPERGVRNPRLSIP